ncbi:hypothetical protein [Hyphomonas sp.]|uniref:hypothetical protein n=1 Tax=Hyphomonas sp. TaxID=87 RepID=UPI001BCBDD92|nr:hypothetical protein [Hyphomonas sp.]
METPAEAQISSTLVALKLFSRTSLKAAYMRLSRLCGFAVRAMAALPLEDKYTSRSV